MPMPVGPLSAATRIGAASSSVSSTSELTSGVSTGAGGELLSTGALLAGLSLWEQAANDSSMAAVNTSASARYNFFIWHLPFKSCAGSAAALFVPRRSVTCKHSIIPFAVFVNKPVSPAQNCDIWQISAYFLMCFDMIFSILSIIYLYSTVFLHIMPLNKH